MKTDQRTSSEKTQGISPLKRLYKFLASRAYSVIIFCALFCNLAAKFYYSYQNDLVGEYFSWILEDVAILVGIEIVLATACFCRPRKLVFRTVTIFSAIVCTWSVMNAGWIIRTGSQILPSTILPLLRAPINALGIIGVNLAKMPLAAVILLGPSAFALTFFFSVLVNPLLPNYNLRCFRNKIAASVIVIIIAILARFTTSSDIASAQLRHNCQLRAVTSFFFIERNHFDKSKPTDIKRTIPAFDEIRIATPPPSNRINHNIVIVVLEGIQYQYTSLGNKQNTLTPYLDTLAEQGLEFANTRSTLTHTTKALFSLLTGRYPCAYHDIAEAVPAPKPYASLVTILKSKLNFRAAFFQSAKGNFECRPGLVYNLGFDNFWAREDISDPNSFLGYLACDEFSMLKPITEWIKTDDRAFLLTIMCSVSHDPYEVPKWFAEPAKESVERYRQAISYTDKFIAALDAELNKLNLRDKTIFCVFGDHGEAFGEHGLHGHERNAFEENLRVPWIIRAPSLIETGNYVKEPVSSIDLTPTLLALLGFDISPLGFDGHNALKPLPRDRKVYFSSWIQPGPAGFIEGNKKYIYNPMEKTVFFYNLNSDPYEKNYNQISNQEIQEIALKMVEWRKKTFFELDQDQNGKKILFNSWLCRWNNRVSSAKIIWENN